MNTQINLRLSENMLVSANKYIEKNGFNTIQEFIKDILREKLFEQQEITKKELVLIKKLIAVTEKNNLYGTEKELFKKLRRK